MKTTVPARSVAETGKGPGRRSVHTPPSAMAGIRSYPDLHNKGRELCSSSRGQVAQRWLLAEELPLYLVQEEPSEPPTHRPNCGETLRGLMPLAALAGRKPAFAGQPESHLP